MPAVPAGLLAQQALAGHAFEPGPAGIFGPYSDAPVYPMVWNGDLRDLPQLKPEPTGYFNEHELFPTKPVGTLNPDWRDPVAQTQTGAGQMPGPIQNFAGLDFNTFGGGWPPDTVGDVGPNHYIQAVNMSVGIYSKTGTRLVGVSYNTFFQGPPGTPCDTANSGDVVVLYDASVDRWIVTDFAWYNFNTGPWFECLAVSQSGDPVSGGWYFYALQANSGVFATYFNDYPKLGVWADGWYMSANMFQPTGPGFGVRVWALNRATMIVGGALQEVHFDLCMDGTCGSLLPSNYRGALPPSGAPDYFAAEVQPDLFQIWKFHVDWAVPSNSTFTGPAAVTIADYAVTPNGVPQQGTSTLLDTLSSRLMMQLQYRNYGSHEALFATHTVAHNSRAAVRWYEVRDPGGTPALFQQGTYVPDNLHRWMASIAADHDGNIALGYSVSSSSMYPAIRYAGRLAGEVPGELPQGEATLIAGTGSQTGISRWGDYSAMSVDPTDDCTFWYTTEYYITSGSNWQTRIGSFKFPSCGQAKGTLTGRVTNAVTGVPVPDAPVFATAGTNQTFTTLTDAGGYYTMEILPGTYTMTAGPALPGYPTPVTVSGVVVAASQTTTQDFQLAPVPYLAHSSAAVDDSVGGNGNGYLEPGESASVFEGLVNGGAVTATLVTGSLSSSTAGVTVTDPNASYPDIAAGAVQTNTTGYGVTLSPTAGCGVPLSFSNAVSTAQGGFSTTFTLISGVPLPPVAVVSNDVEGGTAGWTTGGSVNTWAITTESAHSPTHSWTDSPGGNYQNNTNSWLRTPAFNLSGRHGVRINLWAQWQLEPGYDYLYVEYSTNGGSTWNSTPLYSLNGVQLAWTQVSFDAPQLDNQANAALRFRMYSDAGVVMDGVHLDDFAVTYQPYQCSPQHPLYLPHVVYNTGP